MSVTPPKSTVLFFGSNLCLRILQRETEASNINYRLCNNLRDMRGVKYVAWILHASADDMLRREVLSNSDMLTYYATR